MDNDHPPDSYDPQCPLDCMINKYLDLVGYIERNAHIVLESYLPTTHASRVCDLQKFYSDVKHMMRYRGVPKTIAYVKSSRVAILRTLTGTPLTCSKEGDVHLSDGWPTWLLAWKMEIPQDRIMTEGGLEEIRYLLTVLSSLRSIMVDPVVDISTIIAPYGGQISSISRPVLQRILFSMGFRLFSGRKVCWDRFHFTTKSGPNGPALISSVREFGLAYNTFGPQLKTLGGKTFTDWCEKLSKLIQTDDTVTLGKLSYFADKEGKTRIIAMCDYWTQTVLKPVHTFLMKCLSRLPADCTFDHGRALMALSRLPGPFYSLDLSNATDRMPFWLQRDIMSFFLGHEKAQAWARLLVERDYVLTEKSAGKATVVRPLRYLAGQPMGAYSSWASMAFTHHFIIQWAAYLSRLEANPHLKPLDRSLFKRFDEYVVLGDDVVIADTTVAVSYKRLLSSLDMPYSSAKTHESQDSFEFAKRWVMFRKEVTPFSIGGLGITTRRYSLLFSFLSNQAMHGWTHRDKSSEFDMVSSLIRHDENTRHGRLKGPVRLRSCIDSRTFLYKLFYHLQHIKAALAQKADPEKGWPNGLRESQYVAASSKFHHEYVVLMMSLKSSGSVFSDTSITSLVENSIKVALRQMVERDLRDFQKNAKAAISRALSIPLNVSTGVDAGIVSYWLPPLNVLAFLFKDSLYALCEHESLFEHGIAKYFIGKGVLSMDHSQQVVLAESAVTKKVLDLFLALGKLEEEQRLPYLTRELRCEVKIRHSILSPIEGPRVTTCTVSPVDSSGQYQNPRISFDCLYEVKPDPDGFSAVREVVGNPMWVMTKGREKSEALLRSELGSVPEKTEHQARVFEEGFPVDK